MDGRPIPSVDDVKAIAHPVLRHRIVTNFNADAEGYSPDRIIKKLLELVPAKESSIAANPKPAPAVGD